MGWLLGGVSATGIVGVVALAVYMAKMASSNRSDLHKLVQSAKDLSDARRDNDGYRRRVEERDDAIKSLQEQLIQERAAVEIARKALGNAKKRLAARGDARSVASDINSTLLRLSSLPGLSDAEPPESGDG